MHIDTDLIAGFDAAGCDRSGVSPTHFQTAAVAAPKAGTETDPLGVETALSTTRPKAMGFGARRGRWLARSRAAARSRATRLTAVVGVGLAATLLATASPASADGINLASAWQITGTNCDIEVGTYLNTPYAYPGTSTEVYNCGSRHTITVTTRLEDASLSGGNWYTWATTPTNTYLNAYGTRMMSYYWASCPAGAWQWRVVASVSVDGIYRGDYANAKHTWTACTTF